MTKICVPSDPIQMHMCKAYSSQKAAIFGRIFNSGDITQHVLG